MQKLILAALLFGGHLTPVFAQLPTTADCKTSTLITPTGSYLLAFSGTGGDEANELNGAACFAPAGVSNIETNSRWVRWTCPKDDTITFYIQPLTPTDDIDFVLFRMNGGIGACDQKTIVRCTAAGDFAFPSPCMGNTGLKKGETDLSESSGCPIGQNNFVAPIVVSAGDAFALAINNFTGLTDSCLLVFGGLTGMPGAGLAKNRAAPIVQPNPTATSFTVFFEIDRPGDVQFSLLDLRGQLVFQQKKWFTTGSHSEFFSLENQPAGAYFLKISDGQKTAVSRVVKN